MRPKHCSPFSRGLIRVPLGWVSSAAASRLAGEGGAGPGCPAMPPPSYATAAWLPGTLRTEPRASPKTELRTREVGGDCSFPGAQVEPPALQILEEGQWRTSG